MKSIEEFLSGLPDSPRSACLAITNRQPNHVTSLPDAVRQAANRDWHIFPVSQLAKLNGNPDLLIGEASSNISTLESFASEFPDCGWRVALGPSSLFIIEKSGPPAARSLAAFSGDEEDCFTLQAERGDTRWAFFTWPKGLVLRTPTRKLLMGVRILGPGDSCPIPPTGGSHYINPWADVEPIPRWLLELAFEDPDDSPQSPVRRAGQSPRPVPCRPRRPVSVPPSCGRKGFPGQSQAGLRRGFRIHRRL